MGITRDRGLTLIRVRMGASCGDDNPGSVIRLLSRAEDRSPIHLSVVPPVPERRWGIFFCFFAPVFTVAIVLLLSTSCWRHRFFFDFAVGHDRRQNDRRGRVPRLGSSAARRADRRVLEKRKTADATVLESKPKIISSTTPSNPRRFDRVDVCVGGSMLKSASPTHPTDFPEGYW